jgi:multisubunit Na+/H+ antiporter MnhE subunit
MLQGFSIFRSHVDIKSGVNGLKTGCAVSGMMYNVYPGSMECLRTIFMIIIVLFMIMINLPK